VLTYAKVHTCVFSLEAACSPGDDFHVAPLDTAGGTVDVGATICFDREFSESARILMLKGAELILIPNACEMEANRLSQLRGQAFENMVGIALTNYAARSRTAIRSLSTAWPSMPANDPATCASVEPGKRRRSTSPGSMSPP
jgi:predicted amidohydrolase